MHSAAEDGKPTHEAVKTAPEEDGADAVALPDRDDATTAIAGGDVDALLVRVREDCKSGASLAAELTPSPESPETQPPRRDPMDSEGATAACDAATAVASHVTARVDAGEAMCEDATMPSHRDDDRLSADCGAGD